MLSRFLVIILVSSIAVLPATDNPHTEHDGLQVVLSIDSTIVSMGAKLECRISATFDTTTASAKTRVLNLFSGQYEFVFVDHRTGNMFRRTPYSSGMLRVEDPGNMLRLQHGAKLNLDDATLYLMSEDGEQIPSGTYLISVLYINDGGERVEAYVDSTAQYRRRNYNGRWGIWQGEVTSDPITLTVRAASSPPTDVPMPTALFVDTVLVKRSWPNDRDAALQRGVQIVCTCPKDSVRIVRVTKRPGFALGNRWTLHVVADGDTIANRPRGLGGTAWPMSHTSYLPPDITAKVLSASNAELILDIEIFETSNQPKHGWNPENGIFQVLWAGRVRHQFRSGK